jgi:hypothetical protein
MSEKRRKISFDVTLATFVCRSLNENILGLFKQTSMNHFHIIQSLLYLIPRIVQGPLKAFNITQMKSSIEIPFLDGFKALSS